MNNSHRDSPETSTVERKFATLIRQIDREIMPLIDSINVPEMSRVNAYYRAYETDKFRHFVEIERGRWLKALEIITNDRAEGTVCDLACFIPYLPMALSTLGYKVKMADKYEFYGPAFKDLIFGIAEKKSIQIFDLDILHDDLAKMGKNDVVSLMSVVEHLSGSPRDLLAKIHGMIALNGIFVLEVPNIAEFIKRIRHLFGYSPLADYPAYFDSAYPHIGHNREMTADEVVYLLEHCGFSIQRLDCYDYDPFPVRSWQGKVALLAKRLIPMKYKGDSIVAKSRPVVDAVRGAPASSAGTVSNKS